MAWSLGLADDPDQSAFYQRAIGGLTDERLIELLDETSETRGDGSEFSFATFG